MVPSRPKPGARTAPALFWPSLAIVVAITAGCGGGDSSPAPSAAVGGPSPEILVLSNRADLVSGGDALVEIRWPSSPADLSAAQVRLNGEPLRGVFEQRPNGR